MITKTTDWGGFSLDHAEIGDKLMVSGGAWDKDYIPVTISGLTNTRITTSDGNQWMRASQRLVGADKWSRVSLHLYDEDVLREAKQKRRRQRLVRKISDAKFDSLDIASLEKIAAIVDAEPEKASAVVADHAG